MHRPGLSAFAPRPWFFMPSGGEFGGSMRMKHLALSSSRISPRTGRHPPQDSNKILGAINGKTPGSDRALGAILSEEENRFDAHLLCLPNPGAPSGARRRKKKKKTFLTIMKSVHRRRHTSIHVQQLGKGAVCLKALTGFCTRASVLTLQRHEHLSSPPWVEDEEGALGLPHERFWFLVCCNHIISSSTHVGPVCSSSVASFSSLARCASPAPPTR